MDASWNKKASRQLGGGLSGSVPHIYTKGATLNYFLVMKDRLGRGTLSGSVPPIYIKGATLNYFLVMKERLGRGIILRCVLGFGLRGTRPALAGRLGESEAFGVPQRGTAAQGATLGKIVDESDAF